jgi:hypothetical protein
MRAADQQLTFVKNDDERLNTEIVDVSPLTLFVTSNGESSCCDNESPMPLPKFAKRINYQPNLEALDSSTVVSPVITPVTQDSDVSGSPEFRRVFSRKQGLNCAFPDSRQPFMLLQQVVPHESTPVRFTETSVERFTETAAMPEYQVENHAQFGPRSYEVFNLYHSQRFDPPTMHFLPFRQETENTSSIQSLVQSTDDRNKVMLLG